MGRYGMAGRYYRRAGYITLQDVPDPNREYVESFDNLVGGMNRFDLDYALKGNESPFMQNMSWHNGTLTSRLGQVEKYSWLEDVTVKSCAPFLFHGWMLYCDEVSPETEGDTPWYEVRAVKIQQTGSSGAEKPNGQRQGIVTGRQLAGVPAFTRYRDKVYVKGPGFFYAVSWAQTTDTLSLEPIVSDNYPAAFVPTIQKNTDPDTGAGDPFQQENRLSKYKKVEFNAKAGVHLFHLPVNDIESVYEVAINGTPVSDLHYTVNAAAGTISFSDPNEQPQDGDKVCITYAKPNPQALKSLTDCTVMAVFGGTQDLCIVLGCSEEQPNAYFWSGNNGLVMDPTYFPMNQYNLVGDNDDPITAMAKQQNMLVIFQGNTTGRAVFGTEKISDLETVTMNYTRINAEIGCDLPGSVQLVDNNLVWCSRRYGVCRLKDSSAAYENNIVQISRKINGDYRIDGLLEQLKSVADDEVRSVDTGKRYILVLGDEDGKAYEWNYELSQYDNPSWFYHTNILGVGFVPLANEELYEVTADGKVCTFEPVFKDFEESAIEKIYRFPPRDFGGYDRLKNIKSILVTTRSDAPTNTVLKYTCDYKERIDPTNLVVNPNERNFAVVFRRKPGFHNMHHLGIEMSNNTAGEDLNLLSSKIFYEYRGRQR